MGNFCPNCGKEVDANAVVCLNCGASVTKQPGFDANMASVMVNKKSGAVALILSIIITGLGHIYVGKAGKGAALLVLYILMLILGFLFLFPLIIALIIWIYGLWDSWKLVKEYNAYLLSHNGQTPW